jgi:hypothetical protein
MAVRREQIERRPHFRRVYLPMLALNGRGFENVEGFKDAHTKRIIRTPVPIQYAFASFETTWTAIQKAKAR